jgi:hypothetical protein
MLDLKPLPSIGEIHLAARRRLTDRHLNLMEKVMKDNSHKKKYWILGTARCKRKNGKTTIQPCLNAYDTQPDVRKEAYLYEVDNVEGTKTLLWVMHPDNHLAIPSINKSISAAGVSSAQTLASE